MKEPIVRLPPYIVRMVMTTLNQTVDYGHRMINTADAFRVSRGAGVTVAILDTGLPVHPDLEGAIDDHACFVKGESSQDGNGHSTHCAGIVGARDNAQGVIGIAPDCRLIFGKVLGDSGAGELGGIVQGIKWAREKGADIISMSLGAPNNALTERMFEPVRAELAKCIEAGIVIFAASGNENASKVGLPAAFEECIPIAAVNSEKQRASFSNRGPRNGFALPGVDVLSCFQNGGYARLSGTSMACPGAAGVGALMLGAVKSGSLDWFDQPFPSSDHLADRRNWLYRQIVRICIDLGESGHDIDFGYGLPVFGHLSPDDPKVPPPPPRRTLWEIILDLLIGWLFRERRILRRLRKLPAEIEGDTLWR